MALVRGWLSGIHIPRDLDGQSAAVGSVMKPPFASLKETSTGLLEKARRPYSSQFTLQVHSDNNGGLHRAPGRT